MLGLSFTFAFTKIIHELTFSVYMNSTKLNKIPYIFHRLRYFFFMELFVFLQDVLDLQNTDTSGNSRIAYLTRFGYGYVSDTPWIRIDEVSDFLLFLQILDTFAGYVSGLRHAYL
jgi:hypothetical protein